MLPLKSQEMPLRFLEAGRSLRGRAEVGPAFRHAPPRPPPPLLPTFLRSATPLVLRPGPLPRKAEGRALRRHSWECGPRGGSPRLQRPA